MHVSSTPFLLDSLCTDPPPLPLRKIGEGALEGRGGLYTGYSWTTGLWRPASRSPSILAYSRETLHESRKILLSKRLQRIDVIQTEPPFLVLTQEDKRSLCLQGGPLGTRLLVYNEKG